MWLPPVDSTRLIESRNMLDKDLFTKLFIQMMEPPRNFCGTIQIVQSVSNLEDVKITWWITVQCARYKGHKGLSYTRQMSQVATTKTFLVVFQNFWKCFIFLQVFFLRPDCANRPRCFQRSGISSCPPCDDWTSAGSRSEAQQRFRILKPDWPAISGTLTGAS